MEFTRNFNIIWDSSLTIMITKQTLKYAGTLYIKFLAMDFINMNFLSEEIWEWVHLHNAKLFEHFLFILLISNGITSRAITENKHSRVFKNRNLKIAVFINSLVLVYP